ncbi:MAG: ABC transporter permease [Lachnospiraceae bacterium]|nr:ABC transporter permease [Lachnospiraceae bacterium]
MVKNIKKTAEKAYLILILLLLYIPIALLIISSFNASERNKAVWGGFTLKAYGELIHDEVVMGALYNTLLLAGGASLIATLLGTLVCIGMINMKKRSKSVIMAVTQIPLLNSDIVTGIALMLLFTRFADLSFATMLIAHVTFIIPYVVLSVYPKVLQINQSTYEAALDLGASHLYAMWKVVIPDIMPGILSGFLLAFTMSLDDFSVTYFTKAPGLNTMSTMINAEYRKGIQTEIYALSTIVFIIVLFVLFIINRRSEKLYKLKEESGVAL